MSQKAFRADNNLPKIKYVWMLLTEQCDRYQKF